MPLKRTIIALLSILCLSQFSFSAKVQGYFAHAIFNSPVDGPYIETYLAINGETLKYQKSDDGLIYAEVEIIMIFSKNDTIKYFDKYNLKCTKSDGKEKKEAITYLDIKRIPIPNGIHQFELQFRDLSDKNEKNIVRYSDVIAVNYLTDSIQISDIELVQDYSKTTFKTDISKAGYDINPSVSNFYDEGKRDFTFYLEIYNTESVLGKDEQYLVNYFIESQDSYVQLGKYRRFTKQTSKQVNVLLNKFPIEDLPSGNYNFVVEIRNKENDLMGSKKLFFQRSNPSYVMSQEDIQNVGVANTFVSPMNDIEQLKENIACLYPISSTYEREFADRQVLIGDTDMMKQYFYHFWSIRNPVNPEKLWKEYYAQVHRVDEQYGTIIKKGFETDRGRVFLQYGLPNSISVSLYEPSSYPYEIWHYYKLEDQSNRKFIFYDQSMVTGDYELLHSDARGEQSDPAWRYKLEQRNTLIKDLSRQNVPDHFGGNASNLFLNPR